MISRSEGAGLTVAVIGHLLLFGLLSATFFATRPLPRETEAIEVSISDLVGMTSQAPQPSKEEAAALKAPEEGPPVPAAPAPADTQPEPVAKSKPEPKPAAIPDPAAASAAKAPAASSKKPPREVRAPTGALDGLDLGATDKPSKSESTSPPAKEIGPAQQSAIDAEIRRQLKRFWRAPTGADMDTLRTIVELRLNPDGSLAAEPRLVRQEGVTASNRPQVQLHFEAAVRAIKLAAPFKNLPPEYYDYWKRTGPAFDRRLSQ